MTLSSKLLSHSVCPTAWAHMEAGHLLAQDREAHSHPCHTVPSALPEASSPVSSALCIVLQSCISFYKGERKGQAFVTPCRAEPTLTLYPALPVGGVRRPVWTCVRSPSAWFCTQLILSGLAILPRAAEKSLVPGELLGPTVSEEECYRFF